MKKRSGIARAVPTMSLMELERLPTRALIGRLNRLRWCEESSALSDMTAEEIELVSDKIVFKNTVIWSKAYDDVKGVLATREHVRK